MKVSVALLSRGDQINLKHDNIFFLLTCLYLYWSILGSNWFASQQTPILRSWLSRSILSSAEKVCTTAQLLDNNSTTVIQLVDIEVTNLDKSLFQGFR